jgi:hypothetical protein
MVRFDASRRILPLLLAAAWSGGAPAAALEARLDRSASLLGEAVSLTIEARGLEQGGFGLDALDLAPLETEFEIFARTLSRAPASETLVLTLYPRANGTLRIPPLQAGGMRTAALALNVASRREDRSPVAIKLQMTPAAPWVGEPARLSLSVCDNDGLRWQRPVLPTESGRGLRALNEDEGPGEVDGERCTRTRFHWALIPTRGGTARVVMPMLDASLFGQRLRYPAPTLEYVAGALPAWLPGSIPPVAPRVQASPLPARWPLQRPLAWQIDIEGAYSADGLKSLLAMQLRETPELGVYPPLIEVLAPSDPASTRTRHRVTLTLQPRARGELELPVLNLPWYDPVRERFDRRAVPAQSITVFDPRLQTAGRAGAGLAALALLVLLGRQLQRAVRWRLRRWHGLQAIRQAQDAAQLMQTVRGFSLFGHAPAPSLGAWLDRLQQETSDVAAADAVRRLEQQQFGLAPADLPALRQAFVDALARVRPRRPSA